jgi:hypothetical protein
LVELDSGTGKNTMLCSYDNFYLLNKHAKILPVYEISTTKYRTFLRPLGGYYDQATFVDNGQFMLFGTREPYFTTDYKDNHFVYMYETWSGSNQILKKFYVEHEISEIVTLFGPYFCVPIKDKSKGIRKVFNYTSSPYREVENEGNTIPPLTNLPGGEGINDISNTYFINYQRWY